MVYSEYEMNINAPITTREAHIIDRLVNRRAFCTRARAMVREHGAARVRTDIRRRLCIGVAAAWCIVDLALLA